MQKIKLLGFLKEDIPKKLRKQLHELLLEFELETSKLPSTINFVRETFEAYLPSEIEEFWVFPYIEDEMVGFGYCDQQIKFENLDKGYIRLFVKKNHRRKTIASKMLKFLLDKTRKQVTSISIMAFEGSAGEAFLTKFHGKLVFTEKMIVSNTTDFAGQEIIGLVKDFTEKTSANGYEIKFIPQTELLELTDDLQFVKMIERSWNAMPREDKNEEDVVLTKTRLKESYSYRIKRGDEYHTVIALHNETKALAGYTITRVNKNLPEIGYQHDTGVLSEYQGNRLGLTMKYHLLQHLKNNTSVIYWETGSAASNVYMGKINIILKHKPLKTKLVFEFSKEKLLESVANK